MGEEKERKEENKCLGDVPGSLLCMAFLTACASKEGETGNRPLQVIDDKYRTYYEIFVYSFYDSDGDGIGDLRGVLEKLDYLNDGDDSTDTDLGVNGIWLMPVMPSNTYHKYDTLDYQDIDPQYGTMEDLKPFWISVITGESA